MSPPAPVSRNAGFAPVAGSLGAALCEVAVFHPVDTFAKRLMNNSNDALTRFQVVFPNAHRSLVAQAYAGLGVGVAYKVATRVYKFGGQPFVRDFLAHRFGMDNNTSSAKKALVSACAGSMLGCGEVLMLPLDVLKIKAQTNQAQFSKLGVSGTVRKEGIRNLYRGWDWTLVRNAPGSFFLFGGNSMAQEVMGIQDRSQASFLQTSLSSCCGAALSILSACPADVIKTRVQSGSYQGSGLEVLRQLLATEGPQALMRGSLTKLSVVGPKLIFGFTIAQYLTASIERSAGELERRAFGARDAVAGAFARA